MSDLTPVGAIPPHEVLLWLAGRIDDDLLAWARELIAVGEDDQAVELITATLIADQVSLPSMLREWVVERASTLSAEPDAEAALAPAADTAPLHHFVGEPPAGVGDSDAPALLEGALAGVAERHLPAGSWWLAWRLTPAGSAPGPLPHPMILVELDAGSTSSAEVVAYQVADAVHRSGLVASVEVFTAGTALPDYHNAALRETRGEGAPPVTAPQPVLPVTQAAIADIKVDVPVRETASAAVEPRPAPRPSALPSPAPAPVDDTQGGETWTGGWAASEWGQDSHGGRPLAGLSEAERVLLAQLQDELTARETRTRPRGNGAKPGNPNLAEPPELAG